MGAREICTLQKRVGSKRLSGIRGLPVALRLDSPVITFSFPRDVHTGELTASLLVLGAMNTIAKFPLCIVNIWPVVGRHWVWFQMLWLERDCVVLIRGRGNHTRWIGLLVVKSPVTEEAQGITELVLMSHFHYPPQALQSCSGHLPKPTQA